MKARLTFTSLGGEFFPGKSTIIQICRKALEDTGRYEAEEVHVDGTHCLDIKEA